MRVTDLAHWPLTINIPPMLHLYNISPPCQTAVSPLFMTITSWGTMCLFHYGRYDGTAYTCTAFLQHGEHRRTHRNYAFLFSLAGLPVLIGNVIIAPWGAGAAHTTGKKVIGIIHYQLHCNPPYRNQTHVPSLAFFFRPSVPPNLPRKDSSFFILAISGFPDLVGVPDIAYFNSHSRPVTETLLGK